MSVNDRKLNNQVYDKNIVIGNIGDICTGYMKIFGANNNLMRHIPIIADGLKPGERRILYTMSEVMGITHKGKHKKCMGIVGRTADIHPHGDQALYSTLVKLAQKWQNTICLIDGSGNFGSPTGETEASMRYTEARLSFYSYKCFFEEFNPNIVDMKLSYNGEIYEPEFLPSKYPNVLINQAFGIGYGLSSSIPTYNFKEVIDLTIKLMNDPDYGDIVLIPDSPSGSHIIDDGQFETISKTGKGKFKMRGTIEIDSENNIVTITSVPLYVNSDDVKADIIDLFKENKMQGLKKIDDQSSERNGTKVIFYLKKEVDPVSIMHSIYTKTNMEKTYPINFKLIDDYQDVDYNIRSLLLTWLDQRREVKRRLFNHTLIKAKERQHVLTILLFILNKDNAEKTMSIVKKSENKKEIIKKLMNSYGITSLQADTIAEMKLTAFSKESLNRYIKEKVDIDEKVTKYEKLVRSIKKIDKIIKEELEEGIKLFGEPRRSKIINIDGEVKIRDTNHLVSFTLNGFVKKLPEGCTSIGFINQNDYPIEIIEIRNTTDLLIFDESGKISKLPVHLLQNSELTGEGEKLSKYCNINGSIKTIIPKPTTEILSQVKIPIYFLMITTNGIIKKTLANSYTNIKNDLIGLIVKDGDTLRSVKLLAGDKDVVIYTNKGFGVRLKSDDIKTTSRMSIGIKALELGPNEIVIGMDLVNEKDKYLFALTNHGTGKKCLLSAFKTMDRNSKPLRIISLETNEEVIFIKTVKGNENFKAYMKNKIETINIEEVFELPRLSKGKKILGVLKGDTIIDIKEVTK